MKTKDFYFHLPENLIAQNPLKERDKSRLMVIDRKTDEVSHQHFYNIIDYLNKGDCLVLNDTRVLPARLIGSKLDTGGNIEFLLLKRLELDTWEALAKPGKRAKIGTNFEFGKGLLKAEVIGIGEEGSRIIRFTYQGIFEEILEQLGQMPLPPYITQRLEDKERYQTIYSKHTGSAAAPTAGLHFTEKILNDIKAKGIEIVYVTLHVGLGTFRPVKVDNIHDHKMHAEYYNIDKRTADIINKTRDEGGKILAVGTTSCRTLESAASKEGRIEEGNGWTNIFIYPGYEFKIIDSLITNFHLPESSLIMLVSALVGQDNIINAYKIAVDEKYRFFSFGDAMLIK